MIQILKTACLLLIMCCFINANAQEVKISKFDLIQADKEVLLFWTIDSGSTCNAMTIMRSLDGLDYKEIGYIGGVCGNSSSPTPYNFTDENPLLNTVNFYKLQLGYGQFTEVKSIKVQYIESGKLFVYPNPTIVNTIIEFNNNNSRRYSVIITSSFGNVVFVKDEITESQILLNTFGWSTGAYYIILFDNSGSILKEKLIIK